jgi:adenylyltransferase/sulfurtransferase
VLAHKPYVWGSIDRFCGQVTVFWEDAPDAPDGRRRGLNYRDLYPAPPPPGAVPSCADGGVLGVLCASIGSIMATEAIKLITGIGESLLGRVLIYDALAMSHHTVAIRKDPQAPAVTALIDYDAFCGPVCDVTDATITASQLRDLMASGAPIALIDVREPAEWAINRISGAVLVPKSAIDGGEALTGLPGDATLVLYCKTGVRSAQALAVLHRAGFGDALHLYGGIVAWARELEPDMAMY